jgi:hypothetical protein
MNLRRPSPRLLLIATFALCFLTVAAMAAVSIPPGAQTGSSTQGGRIITAGSSSTEVALVGQSPPVHGEDSLHFKVCFDEGLPTEKPNQEAGGALPAGSHSGVTKFKIPSGAKTCHWVIVWDKDGEWTWGGDGTINF